MFTVELVLVHIASIRTFNAIRITFLAMVRLVRGFGSDRKSSGCGDGIGQAARQCFPNIKGMELKTKKTTIEVKAYAFW